nr:MAG TPA: hypothetical protein [Caudoviricetes sp.]
MKTVAHIKSFEPRPRVSQMRLTARSRTDEAVRSSVKRTCIDYP